MESPSLEKENIIEDVRNLFNLENLKRETTDATLKTLDLFRLKKENEKIKDRILRDIRNFFRLQKEKNQLKI